MATLRELIQFAEQNPEILDLEMVLDKEGEAWGYDIISWEASADNEVLILFTDAETTQFEYMDEDEEPSFYCWEKVGELGDKDMVCGFKTDSILDLEAHKEEVH